MVPDRCAAEDGSSAADASDAGVGGGVCELLTVIRISAYAADAPIGAPMRQPHGLCRRFPSPARSLPGGREKLLHLTCDAYMDEANPQTFCRPERR
jgi:hypothetical protein